MLLFLDSSFILYRLNVGISIQQLVYLLDQTYILLWRYTYAWDIHNLCYNVDMLHFYVIYDMPKKVQYVQMYA